jgi:hypothetical protein
MAGVSVLLWGGPDVFVECGRHGLCKCGKRRLGADLQGTKEWFCLF